MNRLACIAGLLALGATYPPNVLEFAARYELVVQPPAGSQRVRIWFPVPREEPAQEISALEIESPVPYRVTRDPRGNQLVYLEADPASEEIRVVATFDVRRREVAASTDPEQTRAYRPEDLRGREHWLEPDKHVVINERIRELAAKITAGETNPVRAARSIYDWMLENVDYWVKEPALKSASKVGSTTYCLDTGTGNCTDFHSLYASLARAAGIPTRILYGSLFKPELDGKDLDASYHCWLEFYAPAIGWIPVDVAVADIYHGAIDIDEDNRSLVSRTTADGYDGPDPRKVEYYFGHLEPRRVTWTEGRDLALEPPQAGGPVNALPKAYVEVDGAPLQEGNGWKRRFTYVSRNVGGS